MVGGNQGRLKKGNMNMQYPVDASIADGDINSEMKQEAGTAAVESSVVGGEATRTRIKESPKDSEARVKESSSAVKGS